MKHWLILMGMAGLTGCARFEARPLAPAQTAAQLESRRLDDPGLRQFIEQNLGHPLAAWPLPEWDLSTLSLAAFYYHPSLEVARAQWAVARAGIKTAAGRPNPSVSVTPGYDTTTAVPSPWFPMINFDWPLETAGKRGKRMAESQELASSARWELVTSAWQVRSGVRDALQDWQLAERRSTLLDQQFSLEQQIEKRLQQRYVAGEIARTESFTAQIALHRSQMDRLDAQMKSSEAHARLAGALGLTAAALAGIKINLNLPAEVPPALTAPAARHSALTARSDILGALADYAAAEDDVRLEIARQYPDVHFGPGYQFDQGDNKWSLGLTVDLPVLNQNQGPIAEAEARRKLAAAKFMALQAQVIAGIDQAMASYDQAQKQSAYGETVLATEQAQQATAEAQSEAGETEQSEALGAQIEQINGNLVQLDSITQLQRARGALEDALQSPLDSFTLSAIKHLSALPKESQP